MSQDEDRLIQQAKMVLDYNWTGNYTQPGPRLYPHQWSWDSALIAIGYSHYDQDRAEQELRHLFEAQWRKRSAAPDHLQSSNFNDYFPRPQFLGS